MAFLAGSDVRLLDPLKQPLGDIGSRAQGSLANMLGKIQARARTSNVVSGRPQGDYQDFALNQAGTQAGQGINNSLYGALGGASLDELRKQKEFERQIALAKQIGDKLSPSMAQEILGGLSQGVNLAATGKGLYDVLGQSKQSQSQSLPPSLSFYDPYSSGYSRYAGGY